MIVALLSFVGIIVGASLQYVFTRYLENQRHYRALRTQAYMDYLKSICEQAQLAIQPQSRETREIYARTADAKARICLYGSTAAIRAFALFEKLGATMTTNEQRTAFCDMVITMRKDSGSEDGVQIKEIEKLLLGHH